MQVFQEWLSANPPKFQIGQLVEVSGYLSDGSSAIVIGLECSRSAQGDRAWAYMIYLFSEDKDGFELELWVNDFDLRAAQAGGGKL